MDTSGGLPHLSRRKITNFFPFRKGFRKIISFLHYRQEVMSLFRQRFTPSACKAVIPSGFPRTRIAPKGRQHPRGRRCKPLPKKNATPPKKAKARRQKQHRAKNEKNKNELWGKASADQTNRITVAPAVVAESAHAMYHASSSSLAVDDQ